MRKFNDIYKAKLNESESIHESQVLDSFKQVYKVLLETYKVNEFYSLNENTQLAFLTELNEYWTEENGISAKGQLFLENKSSLLTENSTDDQKKNFIKNKLNVIVNESIRQIDLKYKVYDIIDEVYKQINANSIDDVLDPKELTNTIKESLSECFGKFVKGISNELNESSTDQNKNQLYEKQYSEEKRKELAKKGYAMSKGEYPIVTKKDLENAIKSYGRSADKPATKKHIIKRAKALGAMDLIPENWK
jgi:hypothetical protein